MPALCSYLIGDVLVVGDLSPLGKGGGGQLNMDLSC